MFCGFRVQGSGLGFRFRVQGSGFRVQGSGFRVRVQGLGFRAPSLPLSVSPKQPEARSRCVAALSPAVPPWIASPPLVSCLSTGNLHPTKP